MGFWSEMQTNALFVRLTDKGFAQYLDTIVDQSIPDMSPSQIRTLLDMLDGFGNRDRAYADKIQGIIRAKARAAGKL